MERFTDDQIEQFLLKQLPLDEANALEKALAEDDALRQRIRCKESAIGMVQDMGDLFLWQRISAISKENKRRFPSKDRFRRIIRYGMSIAAVVLLGWLGLTFLQPAPNTSAHLFALHFKPHVIKTVRSTKNKSISKAISFYNKGNYKKALPLLEIAPDLTNEQQLVLGICYLEADQVDKAIAEFGQLETTGAHEYVLWYKALSYLKIDELDKCCKTLYEIQQNTSSPANDAKELLEAINEIKR